LRKMLTRPKSSPVAIRLPSSFMSTPLMWSPLVAAGKIPSTSQPNLQWCEAHCVPAVFEAPEPSYEQSGMVKKSSS
jgi:hypothetical protein